MLLGTSEVYFASLFLFALLQNMLPHLFIQIAVYRIILGIVQVDLIPILRCLVTDQLDRINCTHHIPECVLSFGDFPIHVSFHMLEQSSV